MDNIIAIVYLIDPMAFNREKKLVMEINPKINTTRNKCNFLGTWTANEL